MENLDLTKILKDQKGITLYSPLFGECVFEGIYSDELPIVVKAIDGVHAFSKYGKLSERNTEPLLFPSKDNRDWNAFKISILHKRFEPFQKVLVMHEPIYTGDLIWTPDFYYMWDEDKQIHRTVLCGDCLDNEVIPYEGNENLLGTIARHICQ